MIFPNKASPKITDLKNESPPILMGQHFCIQHNIAVISLVIAIYSNWKVKINPSCSELWWNGCNTHYV